MLDATEISKYTESETTKIRKENESIILLNEKYNTPNTSLLLFHFDPDNFQSSEL